jgi:hypothetical protein
MYVAVLYEVKDRITLQNDQLTFSLPLPLLSLYTYHQLVTRAQTTVLNWCKEQLYIPLFICMNYQSNKDILKN